MFSTSGLFYLSVCFLKEQTDVHGMSLRPIYFLSPYFSFDTKISIATRFSCLRVLRIFICLQIGIDVAVSSLYFVFSNIIFRLLFLITKLFLMFLMSVFEYMYVYIAMKRCNGNKVCLPLFSILACPVELISLLYQ